MTSFAFDVLCWECQVLKGYIVQLVKDSPEATSITLAIFSLQAHSLIMMVGIEPSALAGSARWDTSVWTKGGEQTAALRVLQGLVFYCDVYIAVEF